MILLIILAAIAAAGILYAAVVVAGRADDKVTKKLGPEVTKDNII